MECRRSPGAMAGGPPDAMVVVPTTLPAVNLSLSPFDVVNQVSAAQLTTWRVVASYSVNPTYRGRMQAWGHDAAVADAFQNVQWGVFLNDRLVQKYAAGCQLCSILSAEMTPFELDIPPGSQVSLRVLNATATTYVVWGRIRGYIVGANGQEPF